MTAKLRWMDLLRVRLSWFGGRGGLWEPFVDAMSHLGLSVTESRPSAGRALRGTLDQGWFHLRPEWGAEPHLVRQLAERLDRPLRWLRVEGTSPLDTPHPSFRAQLRAEELHGASTLRPIRLQDSSVEQDEPDCEGHRDPSLLTPALLRFVDELGWDTLPRLGRTTEAARSFYAHIPEGWRLPDSAAPPDEELPARVALAERALPPESLPWLRRCLAEAGVLAEGPPPDLTRWERRLLRRMGLHAPPEPESPERSDWDAAWDRLTEADRERGVPGKVAGWKLAPGRWRLNEAECRRLRRALEDARDARQRRWAEAWRDALSGEAELEIEEPS